jgi:hypothetical protein
MDVTHKPVSSDNEPVKELGAKLASLTLPNIIKVIRLHLPLTHKECRNRRPFTRPSSNKTWRLSNPLARVQKK